MATEILAVPEHRLKEVVQVIRAGLKATTVSKETKECLQDWCDQEGEYIKRLEEE